MWNFIWGASAPTQKAQIRVPKVIFLYFLQPVQCLFILSSYHRQVATAAIYHIIFPIGSEKYGSNWYLGGKVPHKMQGINGQID